MVETVELVHRNVFCVLNKTDVGWDMKLFSKVFYVESKINDHFISIIWVSIADEE